MTNENTDKIIESKTIMKEYSVLGIWKYVWKWHFLKGFRILSCNSKYFIIPVYPLLLNFYSSAQKRTNFMPCLESHIPSWLRLYLMSTFLCVRVCVHACACVCVCSAWTLVKNVWLVEAIVQQSKVRRLWSGHRDVRDFLRVKVQPSLLIIIPVSY